MLGIDYRPKKFSDVIGQDKVVRGIQKTIEDDKYPLATAFIGNSGCGKSTIARIVAMALNCHNPIHTDDGIEPCCECPSCKDIIEERFSRNVSVYNGNSLSVDVIRNEIIENKLNYSAMFDKNTVIIIEEAQMVKTDATKDFLTMIEKKRNGVYFILTSTDVKKFSSTYGKDNKSQELNALRSRLSFYNIKPIPTDIIEEYLFSIYEGLEEKSSMSENIVENLFVIARNSKNNLRQAINDFETCMNSNVFDEDGIIELLGYVDENRENEIIYQLANKSKEAIRYIRDSDDLEGNFRYWSAIIANHALRDMSGTPWQEEWLERTYITIKATGNLLRLLQVFSDTKMQCGSYFDRSVFIGNLYKYYTENITPSTNSNVIAINSVKKVKKIISNGSTKQ